MSGSGGLVFEFAAQLGEVDGITPVTARFGYMQRTDIPALLAAVPAEKLEFRLDLDDATYHLSTIALKSATAPACRPGANVSSSPPPASPPTQQKHSICPATAPS